MKNIKRLTAMILAMLILVVSLPTVSVFATTDADMYYGKKMLSQMPNSSKLLMIYDLLVEGCATLQSEITFPDGVTITKDERVPPKKEPKMSPRSPKSPKPPKPAPP